MKSASRRIGLWACAGLSVAVVVASGCKNVLDRLQADVVAENIMLETGDPFGVTRIPTLTVNLASITGSLTSPSTSPVSGATVVMTLSSGASGTVNVSEASAGVYSAVGGTAGQASFVYQSNATYAISMTIPSGEFADEYTTQIVAPARTEVTGLPDTLMGETHTHGTDLVLTLVGSYDRGLVFVVDQNGDITYDSRPTTPQEAVDFALGNFSGTITIPGTAFPTASATYGIVVAGLESTQPAGISTNLHILTRFFAGSAKTALVITD